MLQLSRDQRQKRLDYRFLRSSKLCQSVLEREVGIGHAHLHAEALIGREISVEFHREYKLFVRFHLMIEPRIACDHAGLRVYANYKVRRCAQTEASVQILAILTGKLANL